MPDPLNGVLPPLTLPSNVVYFFDWRYVDHGYLRWLDPDDKPVPVMPAPTPLPATHAGREWLPKGVRIEAVPATVDPEPLLSAAELGEVLFMGGSVLFEEGRYRLFYESPPPDALSPEKVRQLGHDKVLRTAESDDGRTWRFPRGSVGAAGGKHANAVFDPGPTGFHGGCVFRDPQAPPAERYKSVFLGMIGTDALDAYRRKYPGDVDPMAVWTKDAPYARPGLAAWGLCGAVSPDGLSWKGLDEPLLIQHSDTFNAATWNAALGQYVAYPRSWVLGRRSVAVATSNDFRHFSGLRQLLWPDASLRPTDTWYTPGYTTVPGSPDYHLAFVTLWSQLDDTFTPTLHSSPDGLVWSRTPAPSPVVPRGPHGSWCQCGGAVANLVPFGPDRVAALLLPLHVPHKYPRVLPGYGFVGWASWQRGRIAALRADAEGEFSLYPLRFTGRKLVLNFRTAPHAGRIQVEVNGKPGRSFADCDPITGDALDHTVTWKGQHDIGHADGEPVQLKFRLSCADLFSVRFE